MRILLINYEYPPVGAGAANATFHLAHSLGAAGHVVAVLTAQFRGQRGWIEHDGVSVFRCAAKRTRPDRSGIVEMLTFIAGDNFSGCDNGIFACVLGDSWFRQEKTRTDRASLDGAWWRPCETSSAKRN